MELPLLYCWDEQILYIGRQADRGIRTHEAVPVAVLLTAIEGDVSISEIDADQQDKNSVCYLNPSTSWQDSFTNDLSCSLMLDPFCEKRLLLDANTTQKDCFHRGIKQKGVKDKIQQEMKFIYQERPQKDDVEISLENLFSNASYNQEAREIDPRIIHIGQTLRENFQQKKTTAELAETVSLSEVHLVQLFKKEVGTTIGKYVFWRRFMSALQSVLAGQNVTDSAMEAGFADTAHFSRAFKAATGVSPDKYWHALQALAMELSGKA